MTAPETVLWGFSPSLAAAERASALAMERPPAFEWVNRWDFCDFADSIQDAADPQDLPLGQVAPVDLSDAPTPRWRCSAPDFAPDLIFEGELFASRALRDALALDDRTVRYLPVDCTECPPAMRAADYRLMNLLAFANPIDRDRTSPRGFTDVTLADGNTTFVWTAPPWQPGQPTPCLQWRAGFVSPAPLFRVPGSAMTLATDELADRVMRAGRDDIAFMDMTNDGTRTEGLVYRML